MPSREYRGWSRSAGEEIPFRHGAVEEFLLKTTITAFGRMGVDSCYVLTNSEESDPTVYAIPAEIEEGPDGYHASLALSDDDTDPHNAAMRFRATGRRVMGTTPFPAEEIADVYRPEPTEIRKIGGVRVGRAVDAKAVKNMNAVIDGKHRESLQAFRC